MSCVSGASIQKFVNKPEVRVVTPALTGIFIAVIAALRLSHVGASPLKMLGWTVIPAMGGLIGSVALGIYDSEKSS